MTMRRLLMGSTALPNVIGEWRNRQNAFATYLRLGEKP